MKKQISRIALIEAALTLLWVILMIANTLRSGPINTVEQAIQTTRRMDLLYYLNYINAALLTGGAMLLYAALYRFLKTDFPRLALAGAVFVPLYGALNFFAYLSQITVVPALAARGSQSLAQWLQIWPQSPVALLNQAAYTLLGIASILFGIALMRKDSATRMAAWLLILNGIACTLGFIGVLIGNAILSLGSLIGGFLFLVGVAVLGFQYRRG